MSHLSNYWTDEKHVDKDGKKVPQFRSLAKIREKLKGEMRTWPRGAGGVLFIAKTARANMVPDPSSVKLITRLEEFEVWLKEELDLYWAGGSLMNSGTGVPQKAITLKDLFWSLKGRPFMSYTSIEHAPQWPRREGVYYVPRRLPRETDGSALEAFLGRLNAASEDDRKLLMVMLLTLFWGGSDGQRPAFVIMSHEGRGVGKTTTAEALLRVVGGAIQPDPQENTNRIMEAFFTERALGQRAVLVDNVKGNLGLSTFERMITSRFVEGHKLHHGRASRPNGLTWVFTSNTPTLSNDLASRAVVIKVGARRDGDFEGWLSRFLAERLDELMADVQAVLEGEQKGTIQSFRRGRFVEWTRGVLEKLEDADRLAALIVARRAEVDAESAETADFATALRELIEERGFDLETSRVKISWEVATRKLNRVFGLKLTPRMGAKRIRELLGTPEMDGFIESRHTKNGRGMEWVGEDGAESPRAFITSLVKSGK